MTTMTEQEAEALLERIQKLNLKGGALASVSHLKAALYDWRVEQQWSKTTSAALVLDNLGFMFITFTKRQPRHCTLRHFFVLEEARGKGIGAAMMELLEKHIISKGVRYLRFFANKPSIGFYERQGYAWHGMSKTGLPFTYWDVTRRKLAPLPNSQRRYLVSRTFAGLNADRRRRICEVR
tara:strand:- start:690 stop:1229 length:540 start_codon:yes stop_codon:yes gene_type:complete